MKTRYRYINFALDSNGRYSCLTNKGCDLIGSLEWNNRWRQFEFIPAGSHVAFTQDCLADIRDFIRQLEQEKKEKKS